MAQDISARVFGDPVNNTTTLAITWYARLTHSVIDREVENLIKQEVRKLVNEDSVLRARVREAIEVAALSMPLDAIAKAVNDAVTLINEQPKCEPNV